MTRTIKTKSVLEVWNILNAANYKQLDDADKVKLWRIARIMKPIAKQFEDDSRDASEKLKPDGFDEQFQKAKDYEDKIKAGKTDNLPMTESEHNKFVIEMWRPFNQLVAKAVEEFAEKEVEIDFEPLSEDAFGKLMASNEWTMEQTVNIGMLIVE